MSGMTIAAITPIANIISGMLAITIASRLNTMLALMD